MPDLLIRHIDNLLAERIQALARDRQGSVNDVVLAALRRGLGIGLPGETSSSTFSAAKGPPWDDQETAAFQEAMQALAAAQPNPLAAATGD